MNLAPHVTVGSCGAGEGTLHQFRELGLDIDALEVVLLTHHHGDHIFGLPGLVAARYERQCDLGCASPHVVCRSELC